MRRIAALIAFAVVSLPLAAGQLSEPLPSKLPRWRGFNLLEKFYFSGEKKPFVEDDFRLISELGFNFVRLPMDYRGYIVGGDWESFDEQALAQIDQAVEWGGKHGVHVCLNLHRAPGWTVAKPPEETDLWTEAEPRRVAAKHWGMFAKRYRGVPNARLSFNLFNEPAGIELERYVEVVAAMLEAIRAEDSGRLVICDGVEWGRQPVDEFIGMKVAMMTRGYSPFQISHYKAGWVDGSDRWPEPRWPLSEGTNGVLIGPAKGELCRPLKVDGPVAAGSIVKLVVEAVSSRATVVVTADGEEIGREEFVADPEDKRWEKVARHAEWNSYWAEGAVEMQMPVERAAKGLELRTVAGDWLSLKSLAVVAPGGAEASVGLSNRWSEPLETLRYAVDEKGGTFLGIVRGREWLRGETIDPWLAFVAKGGGVMVGEWGAFQQTPHDVVLAWAEDCLRNWKEAGWGWALWNFRGSFGVLDSGRSDVDYEEFRGHKLDREFLELLRRY